MAEADLDVYNYGIDTILVCYCLDKEINKTPEYMKAGEHLQTFVKKNRSKKKAAGESDDEEDEYESDEEEDSFDGVNPGGSVSV